MAIDELEKKLRPPEVQLAISVSYLALVELMVVRSAGVRRPAFSWERSIPLGVAKDFYDIVARVYNEILAWFRYRISNEFVLVGSIKVAERRESSLRAATWTPSSA